MIWYPQSSSRFLATFPLAEHYPLTAFGNGDEPIAAVCCSYVVMADGHGIVAVSKGMRRYCNAKCWHKPMECATAADARAVIGRAPLTREWFERRGWLREEVPCE